MHVGDVYKNGKYTVEEKLGWGHFSTVWLVRDNTVTGKKVYCAMKVQKSASHYTEAAYDEIELLNAAKQKSKQVEPLEKRCRPDNFVVKLVDHFAHKGPNGKHVCMLFELLGDNLLTLIKYYDYRGIPLHLVRQISYQLCVGR